MGPWMEGRVLRGLTMLIKEFYSSKSPFNILKCDAMLYQTSHISHILSAKWPKTSHIPPIFRKVKLPYFPYFFFMSRWAPCPQTNLIAYHRSDLHTYISEPTERTGNPLINTGIGISLVSLETATSCALYVYAGHSGPVCWYAANLMLCRCNVLSTLFHSTLKGLF